MKKLIATFTLSVLLAGCANNADILAARGDNASLITDAELRQARKQRANEVEETQAKTQQATGIAGAAIAGAAAVASAAGAAHSVLSLFR